MRREASSMFSEKKGCYGAREEMFWKDGRGLQQYGNQEERFDQAKFCIYRRCLPSIEMQEASKTPQIIRV